MTKFTEASRKLFDRLSPDKHEDIQASKRHHVVNGVQTDGYFTRSDLNSMAVLLVDIMPTGTAKLKHAIEALNRAPNVFALVLVDPDLVPEPGEREIADWLLMLHALFYGRVYTLDTSLTGEPTVIPIHFEQRPDLQGSGLREVSDGQPIALADLTFNTFSVDSRYLRGTYKVATFRDPAFWKGNGNWRPPRDEFARQKEGRKKQAERRWSYADDWSFGKSYRVNESYYGQWTPPGSGDESDSFSANFWDFFYRMKGEYQQTQQDTPEFWETFFAGFKQTVDEAYREDVRKERVAGSWTQGSYSSGYDFGFGANPHTTYSPNTTVKLGEIPPKERRNYGRGLAMPEDYTVLGVSYGAPLDECRKAYKQLAKVYHPNNGSAPDEDKMSYLNTVWSRIESTLRQRH